MHRPVDSGNENCISIFEYLLSKFDISEISPVILYWPFLKHESPFILLIVTCGNEFIFCKLFLLIKSILFKADFDESEFNFSINYISFTSSVSILNDTGVPG